MSSVRNANSIYIGKYQGRRLVEKRTHRWGDNIKMNITELGCDDVKWIEVAQDCVQRRVSIYG
jgi:hypothetical protein